MKKMPNNISDKKLNGRVYTPDFIVDNILDLSDYFGQKILKKHVIDNSCGNGAFLISVVNRYCTEYLKHFNDLDTLAEELAQYVHGIDISETECKDCISNLNVAIKQYGLEYVKWDIRCADSMKIDIYNGKMDYVLGNPPYVRIHNLTYTIDDIKSFSFSQNGMTDLFIVFYEIGLTMLNATGTLGYITPSSFFNSIAAKYMRAYLTENNLIDKIVDLEHYQAFSATTYSAITILKKNRRCKSTKYYKFDIKNNRPHLIAELNKDDYYIADNFYFSNKDKLSKLKHILTYKSKTNNFSVKNGFATLADNFFIGNFNFNEFTIPVIKASTGKGYKCLFPYRNNKLISYDELTTNTYIKNYFETNKEILLNRSLEKNAEWYGFGRSQAINDVYKCKYSINSLIKTVNDLKIIKCDKGIGIFGGLYILTEIEENELKNLLFCDDFIDYVSTLGKYKNGGYYTFSSQDLKNYLEYTYIQKKEHNNEQFSIFRSA